MCKSMKNEIDLMDCPFCGSKAYVGIETMATYWTIGCGSCPCDFQRRFKTKEIAVTFWNKRAYKKYYL